MGDRTEIEWADASLNAIRARNKATGGLGHYCSKVSDECTHCYAERFQPRRQNPIRYAAQDRQLVDLELDENVLGMPLHWRRPRRIFVCSMTDLFGDFVPLEWIDKHFAMMARARHHTFLVLTKRAKRMHAYLTDKETPARIWRAGYEVDLCALANPPQLPLPNVHIGVTAGLQSTANERVPLLLRTPAAVRWISAEPLLESVDLIGAIMGGGFEISTLSHPDRSQLMIGDRTARTWLHQVVAGGESGQKARPMHPDWARQLQQQCQAAGWAFFFKQWGVWAPIKAAAADDAPFSDSKIYALNPAGALLHHSLVWDPQSVPLPEGTWWMRRSASKSESGRLLDGQLHEGMPA